MITVYGIKNCDTCRKALKWLESEGLAHSFCDFRLDGLESDTVVSFVRELGLEALVNRRSTSWRGLDEGTRAIFDREDQKAIVAVLLDNPTLIKRPVFETPHGMFNGFGAVQQAKLAQA